jgi:hypothetical protein
MSDHNTFSGQRRSASDMSSGDESEMPQSSIKRRRARDDVDEENGVGEGDPSDDEPNVPSSSTKRSRTTGEGEDATGAGTCC